MGPKSLKIVIIIALAASMLLSRSALAAIGSSANYILENTDNTNSSTGGTSANYSIDGIADGYLAGTGDDYNICGGLTEELYGDCLPPPTPPSPPSGGGTIVYVAGGTEETPEGETPTVIAPEEAETEIPPEEPVGPQIITFPEDDFVDRTIFPFIPPGAPLPPQPGAPPAQVPEEPEYPSEQPPSPDTDYQREIEIPSADEIQTDEAPGLYPAPEEKVPGDTTLEKIQQQGEKIIVKVAPEKEKLSPLCLCLIILLILLLFILFSVLGFIILFTDKQTKEKINRDINKNLKKLKKNVKKKLLP